MNPQSNPSIQNNPSIHKQNPPIKEKKLIEIETTAESVAYDCKRGIINMRDITALLEKIPQLVKEIRRLQK